MKRIFSLMIAIAIAITMPAVEVFANPKVNKGHASQKTANGKAINCGYCHGPVAKKKGQGMLKGEAKYAGLAKMPACSGAGCHN